MAVSRTIDLDIMPRIPGSLRALLTNIIDYAGLYPPAALPLPEVIANYRRYLDSPESWMLNRLVLPFVKLEQAGLRENWRVTLLVEGEPGPLPAQIETLETKSTQRLSLPTYCEAPLSAIQGGYAKIRTGGVTADATPPAEVLADFLHEAAARRIPFKATAGLHHPVRAAMHGFINVFVAAAFAFDGADEALLVEILDETDRAAFVFGERELAWRGRTLGTPQIGVARRDFAHSFGSCSFEEPVADLRELGWLPG
jgi:hypothetical protein